MIYPVTINLQPIIKGYTWDFSGVLYLRSTSESPYKLFDFTDYSATWEFLNEYDDETPITSLNTSDDTIVLGSDGTIVATMSTTITEAMSIGTLKHAFSLTYPDLTTCYVYFVGLVPIIVRGGQ